MGDCGGRLVLRHSDPRHISWPLAGVRPEVSGRMSERALEVLGAQRGLADGLTGCWIIFMVRGEWASTGPFPCPVCMVWRGGG